MKNYRKILLNIFIILISIAFLLVAFSPLIFGNTSYEKYIKDYPSLILVFLTYIYVLLTFLILNSNNRLAREQLRPYVIVSFNREESFVYFSIKNYGKRPALNTKVNISDGFEELQIPSIRGNYRHLLEQKFLAPNQEIKNLVSDIAAIIRPQKEDAKKCFDFKIEFYDTDGKKYKLEYQIDFTNHYAKMTMQDETISGNLKKIYEEIKEGNKILKEYFKKSY